MAVTLNASTSSGFIQTADTSGELNLQSNGTTKLSVLSTGVNIGQFAGGVITSGTAVASTSGTNIDFTGIPSWVNRVTVLINQMSTNGTSSPQIQIGSGSFSTTGYLSTAVGAVVGSTPSGNVFSSGFVMLGGNTTAAQFHQGRLTLIRITGNTWTAEGSMSVTSGTVQMYVIDGTITLGGVLDRVRLTTVSGDTFDAGTINILYEG
jgi:hypothetical protein